MTPEQIATWAAAGESETLEFKRTTGERREATRTLCAMLNHRGGRVLFGVEAAGRVVGQQVSDHTLEELARELSEIDPPAFPSIDRVPLGNDREVLVVSVSPGHNRPYSYRGQAYRRVGSTDQTLSRDEYNRMLLERVHGEQRWENQPATGWSVADLGAAEITKTIEEAIRRGRVEDPGTRDLEVLLRGLGLTREGVLLRAALVLFGQADRLAGEFPQCLLRVARFAGIDKTEFLDNRQFRANAFELLLAAERFLREHVPVAGRVVPGRLDRVDEPLYPPLAVREALANAFFYRDYAIGGGSVGVAIYDDRLEVTSSGPLHFGLTPEALFGPQRVVAVEPAHRRCLLPARDHRVVGTRDAEDGGAGGVSGSAAPRDRGRRRVCDGQVPPHALCPATAGREGPDRTAAPDSRAAGRQPGRSGAATDPGGLGGSAARVGGQRRPGPAQAIGVGSVTGSWPRGLLAPCR